MIQRTPMVQVLALIVAGAVDPAVARVNAEMDAIIAELKRLICHMS